MRSDVPVVLPLLSDLWNTAMRLWPYAAALPSRMSRLPVPSLEIPPST